MSRTTLLMPRNNGKVKASYYKAYYDSVARSAMVAGYLVAYTENAEVWCGGSVNAFSCVLGDKQFIMDFSDLKPFQIDPGKHNCPYFKWQYSSDRHDHIETKNVYPLCPLQDYKWEDFMQMQGMVNYEARGNTITNNQRVRAAARGRRGHVRKILRQQYGNLVSFEFIRQSDWWRSHNSCLAAVHVPGARNDMLDRGQLELMGLGVCVISPTIVTVLAGGLKLKPNWHYMLVKDDYSNLVDVIEFCRNHRNMCKETGKNAKALFNYVGTPAAYWHRIGEVLNNVST